MYHEHGDYSIDVRDRYMVIRAIGSTNVVTFQRFVDEFKEIAGNFPKDQPWGSVLDLRQWDLHVPEVEEMIEALNLWCVNNGKRFSARVINQSLFQKKVMERLDEKGGDFEIAFFHEEQEAVEWLEAKLESTKKRAQ